MNDKYNDFMDKQIFNYAYNYYKNATEYSSYVIFHNTINNYIISEQYGNILNVIDAIGQEFVKFYGIPRSAVDIMIMNYFTKNNLKKYKIKNE